MLPAPARAYLKSEALQDQQYSACQSCASRERTGRVRAALAATTGVETPADVAKYLLAGADVVMTTSVLLRHGPEHVTVLLDGLTTSMALARGSS